MQLYGTVCMSTQMSKNGLLYYRFIDFLEKVKIIFNSFFQTKRNAIIFGDIADRANANNPSSLTRNASLDESLDNMKISSNKPRKSVTFKDC